MAVSDEQVDDEPLYHLYEYPDEVGELNDMLGITPFGGCARTRIQFSANSPDCGFPAPEPMLEIPLKRYAELL